MNEQKRQQLLDEIYEALKETTLKEYHDDIEIQVGDDFIKTDCGEGFNVIFAEFNGENDFERVANHLVKIIKAGRSSDITLEFCKNPNEYQVGNEDEDFELHYK